MMSYKLKLGREDKWEISREDGTVCFTLLRKDKTFAEEILANLNKVTEES
jgi:hypothetical protein